VPTIKHLDALEILDSRGRPTVKATCTFVGGVRASASVPSGASTGRAEALELRDGDPARYGGLGCCKAVQNVRTSLAQALAGETFADQAALDERLCDLDGTPNKARLGANALLAVSLAFARTHAGERGVPLYAHFADLLGEPLRTLPRLTVNLFSGGKHAGGQVPLQDVLVVPLAARTVDESLSTVYAVYQAAATLVAEEYAMRALTADEGGLAPPFPDAEAMLSDATEAVRRAGRGPGREVALAVDVASSHLHEDGHYHLGGEALTSEAMVERLVGWAETYPILSVEDGLAEEDWAAWPVLRRALEGRAWTLGDDLLCTNPERIDRAVRAGAADALLLKVNQVGTLTEAARAHRLARAAGWRVVVSARSGETEDNWLADLAVGWGGDALKVGSVTRSERLAKYNRLLEIEAQTRLPLAAWSAGETFKTGAPR